MEQYSGQLQELVSFKQILNARYQDNIRRKVALENQFQECYQKIVKKEVGYWETKRAVAASKEMLSLQKKFTSLKKELLVWANASKETKAAIRAIQIHRSNPVS